MLIPFNGDEAILASGEEGLRLDDVLRRGEVFEAEGLRPFRLGNDLLLFRVGDIDCLGGGSGFEELREGETCRCCVREVCFSGRGVFRGDFNGDEGGKGVAAALFSDKRLS